MRTLLMSQRRIAKLVAYCAAYEFEDTLAAVTDAARFDVDDFAGLEFSRRAYKAVRLVSGSRRLARQLAPVPKCRFELAGEFDLFFPVFSHAFELYSLATIPDWRKRCQKAACYIVEAGSNELPAYLLELLNQFDHVFIGTQKFASDLARLTSAPCSFLPLAADVLRFTPDKPFAARPIAICNIGRRSTITHRALLERPGDASFYYFDTVAASGSDRTHRTFQVDDPRDHRIMLATLAKNSRYFIANRSYVNDSEFKDRDEISGRFYEGAAAGAVLVGEPPRNAEFRRQFDWQDAVIGLPFDSPEVCRILAELDEQPERLQAASRTNAREAALRHDWSHRIRSVFAALGLEPTPGMQARQHQLLQITARMG